MTGQRDRMRRRRAIRITCRGERGSSLRIIAVILMVSLGLLLLAVIAPQQTS